MSTRRVVNQNAVKHRAMAEVKVVNEADIQMTMSLECERTNAWNQATTMDMHQNDQRQPSSQEHSLEEGEGVKANQKVTHL